MNLWKYWENMVEYEALFDISGWTEESREKYVGIIRNRTNIFK